MGDFFTYLKNCLVLYGLLCKVRWEKQRHRAGITAKISQPNVPNDPEGQTYDTLVLDYLQAPFTGNKLNQWGITMAKKQTPRTPVASSKVPAPLWETIKPKSDISLLDDELLGPKEVMAVFGFGPTELHRKIQSLRFPQPIIIAERTRRWRKSHLEIFVTALSK